MKRFKPMILGALGLGVAALASTGASAQVRHGGYAGGYHGGYHGASYGGGYYGGHHGWGGGGFWPAALAVGALTGAIGAVAQPDYGYAPYPAYAGYAPYPAYGYGYAPYPYPAYGVAYAPQPYYYGRAVYAPRRVVRVYGGHRGGYRGHGIVRAGYRVHR